MCVPEPFKVKSGISGSIRSLTAIRRPTSTYTRVAPDVRCFYITTENDEWPSTSFVRGKRERNALLAGFILAFYLDGIEQ